MKKMFLFLALFVMTINYGQILVTNTKVGINTVTPQSPLDVVSSNGGILIPRLTEEQRDSIVTAHESELIYVTDQNRFEYFSYENIWKPLSPTRLTDVTNGSNGITSNAISVGSVTIGLPSDIVPNYPLFINSEVGVRFPRFDNTIRNSHIENLSETLFFNTEANAYQYFNNGAYRNVATDIKANSETLIFDGIQTVFNIPHGLDHTPNSMALTFSDGSNVVIGTSTRTINSTNITITCASPPTGTIIVYWQVFN